MASEWPYVSIAELVAAGSASLQTGPFGSQLHKHDYVPRGVSIIPTEAIGRGAFEIASLFFPPGGGAAAKGGTKAAEVGAESGDSGVGTGGLNGEVINGGGEFEVTGEFPKPEV